MFWARRKDGKVNDAKAGDGIDVEDAAIHEEFAEVFANVGDGGRIRGAKVDEEDGFHSEVTKVSSVTRVTWTGVTAVERRWDVWDRWEKWE